MRKLSLLVLIPLFFLLSGCGPVYQTTNSFVPPQTKSGQMCLSQCQIKKEQCNQNCQSQIAKCQKKAKNEAMYNYLAYQSQQQAAGQPVTRTLNDFYNDASNSCNATDCGCDSSYSTCFLSCGGKIIPQTHCVAFCDKAK